MLTGVSDRLYLPFKGCLPIFILWNDLELVSFGLILGNQNGIGESRSAPIGDSENQSIKLDGIVHWSQNLGTRRSSMQRVCCHTAAPLLALLCTNARQSHLQCFARSQHPQSFAIINFFDLFT
jgi:hypothetical protein